MSTKKIDPESVEFKNELEKTIKFTDKVINQFGWVYNPDKEIKEGIQMGLTRNKLLQDKRYCPCFFVTGNKEEDRICPCPPAIKEEIPQTGTCHCQIYCTPEYAQKQKQTDKMEEIVHTHSRGLKQEECVELVEKKELDGEELQSLLEARNLKMIDFKLIDVREPMEWNMGHIVGADLIIPTSNFFDALEEADLDKTQNIILYCHVGSRSVHCARILKDMGFEKIGNLTYGIVSFYGDVEQ